VTSWPPDGVEPIDVADFYERLADMGVDYGPAFQGLRKAWRRGSQIFAEVGLDGPERDEAESFGVHPALLDSALHGIALLHNEESAREQGGMPFAWSDVWLHARGASELRVSLEMHGGRISLSLADQENAPIGEVGSLRLVPVSPDQLPGAPGAPDGLLATKWLEVTLPHEDGVAVDGPGLATLGRLELDGVRQHESLRALCEELDGGARPPQAVFWEPGVDGVEGNPAAQARASAQNSLGLLQQWLAREELTDTLLVIVTRTAAAVEPGASPDLAMAPLWGFMRCAQSEHPERLVLVDLDDREASLSALPSAAMVEGEPELALREGVALVPRLVPLEKRDDSLIPPPGAWRLEPRDRRTPESLSLVPAGDAHDPLGPSEVRLEMRAVSLSASNVSIATGLDSGDADHGVEGSGLVVEVGSEVSDLVPGDRVMGTIPGPLGSIAVADRDFLAPIPENWSFEQAAGLLSAFLIAYYGLVDLAKLEAGERVLVQAATSAVGMAAVQLATQIGAEVFASAIPAEWDALRAAGIPDDHIGSSLDTGLEDSFLAQANGNGIDVILSSVADGPGDAPLALLTEGGRFIGASGSSLDPEEIEAKHPGVAYRACRLAELSRDRYRGMLAEVAGLVERGALDHLPITAWDVRRARQAVRQLQEADSHERFVLSMPSSLDPDATVLITGGTGDLGALLARHLVTAHGVRHLLLVSRRGLHAEGATELRSELTELGAAVRVEACDVSDRAQLETLFATIPAEHPLGAVVHTAVALADGTIETIEDEQVERVFSSKAESAWHLHELTAESDLSAFVLFSSLAGTLGRPGVASYAAANVFLDALAAMRHAQGLPATSIGWGLWARSAGLDSVAEGAEGAAIGDSGIVALSNDQGLGLFDSVLRADHPAILAAPFDRAGLRARESAGTLPPILREMTDSPRRRRRARREPLASKLASVPVAERARFVRDLVCAEIAEMLGDTNVEVAGDTEFKEFGLDSLAAVELRNRLNLATGLRIPASVAFDYPTPAKLAGYLQREAEASGSASAGAAPADNPFGDSGTADTGIGREIGALIQRASDEGDPETLFRLLGTFAPFRPSFDEPLAVDAGPAPVRLAEGSQGVPLFCLTSAAFTSGPNEYMAFARAFEGVRDVVAILQPGFRPGELVPATLELAIETHAETIMHLAQGREFALVGHSTGGLYAHLVAEHLASLGAAPIGVVAIDTHRTDVPGQIELMEPALKAMLALDGEVEAISITRLTGMGAHWRLLGDWALRDPSTPTLLVRASDPVPGFPPDSDWRCSWGIEREVDAPGDHFTLMKPEHVATTAAAIEEWLAPQELNANGRGTALAGLGVEDGS